LDLSNQITGIVVACATSGASLDVDFTNGTKFGGTPTDNTPHLTQCWRGQHQAIQSSWITNVGQQKGALYSYGWLAVYSSVDTGYPRVYPQIQYRRGIFGSSHPLFIIGRGCVSD
jgi:hypothetical protein